MKTDISSVWNIFYRSTLSPNDFTLDFGKTNRQGYFWRLCGIYLCLPMLVILAISYVAGQLDGDEVLIIGAQVALLLPLLFLSIWLFEKLLGQFAKVLKQESGRDRYWLLASNYFYLISALIALIVLLANLVPHRIIEKPPVSFVPFLIFIAAGFLWARSAVLQIRNQIDSSQTRAIIIAIGGAVCLTLSAWLVIGLIGIAILLPIGLSM
ncbi:MAG: hypothetical protein WBN59_08555 [Flavobacteriaceae bacterium]